MSPACQFEWIPVVGGKKKKIDFISHSLVGPLFLTLPVRQSATTKMEDKAESPQRPPYCPDTFSLPARWPEVKGAKNERGKTAVTLHFWSDNSKRKKGPANLTQTKQIAFSSTTGLRTLKVFLLNWLLVWVPSRL